MSTFAKLKIKAIKAFGNFGAWVFDEWRQLNDAFFYGKNIVGEIIRTGALDIILQMKILLSYIKL